MREDTDAPPALLKIQGETAEVAAGGFRLESSPRGGHLLARNNDVNNASLSDVPTKSFPRSSRSKFYIARYSRIRIPDLKIFNADDIAAGRRSVTAICREIPISSDFTTGSKSMFIPYRHFERSRIDCKHPKSAE